MGKRRKREKGRSPNVARPSNPVDDGQQNLALRDLWADESPSDSLTPDIEPDYHLPKKKVPSGFNTRPTDIAAVEIVPPGCSYNPSYEDHQNALGAALAHVMEEKRMDEHYDHMMRKKKKETRNQRRKRRKKEKEELAKKIKVKEEPLEGDDLGEGSLPAQDVDDVKVEEKPSDESLDDDDESNDDDDDDDDDDVVEETDFSKLKPSKVKLSAKQRKAAAKQRRQLAKKRRRSTYKRRKDELDRVRSIAKQVDAELLEQEEAAKERKQRREEAKREKGAKRLGPYDNIKVAPDVMLTEELPKSLRNLPSNTRVWDDTMASYHKRNIIERRVKQRKRPRRTKTHLMHSRELEFELKELREESKHPQPTK